MITYYLVRNLHCAGCAARIEEALERLPEVEHASIDITVKRLRLEGEPVALDVINKIAASIEANTYVEEQVKMEPGASATDEHEHRWVIPQMVVSAALLACGLLFAERLEAHFPPLAVKLVLFGLPYVLCGHTVLIKGARSLLKGDFFNEFTLMGGATIVAIAIGQLSEAVGVMLFYCIGEYFQDRAAGRSRRSIKALLAARPTVAHVLLEDGQISDKTPEELRPGMRIMVKPGEKIPLDGVVEAGDSNIDTSPLTGEPVPVRAASGFKVFAGTVNLDGALTVRVTAFYENSSVARIMEMVESATARKAPTERFITRFARYYTPAVAIIAILVAVLPPLFGVGPFKEWIYRALVLLVISCPCALVLSIPLGYFGGIGAASRRGILVKGGNVLDALKNIKTVAFDKTGTLTKGVFAVSRIIPSEGVDEKEVLHVAALAESRSNHPLARSILQSAGMRYMLEKVEAREISGKGIVARHKTNRILAGNASLLAEYGISVPETNEPGTVVYVARDDAYLGLILVSDLLRPESAETVRELHDMGIGTVAMLTGDRMSGAVWVAEALKVDEVRAELLPEDKAAALESLGPKEQTMFVGDGINDAPVLAGAGVSVAMGGLGAQAAVEIADAVILDDSPSRVVDLIRIGARTRTIVWQNIVMSLGIKGAFMILGIVGVSGLWEAVFADVGVALLAVLNATRTARAA